MKFSALINCFNEEECIELAIKSIYKFVDEIIIVDNASDDNTKNIIDDILINFDLIGKIKFFPLTEPMQLAEARNLCLSKASHDWIIKWDGDFVAYEYSSTDSTISSFDNLLKLVSENSHNYDFFLLHTINVSGDVFHYDVRRKYLGLSGDSFIGRKDCIKYVVSNYPDTGLLKRPDGSSPRFYYLNKPNESPIYFLHLFGVKPMSYHLYRAFMSKYQIWISENSKMDFWDWFVKFENSNIDAAIAHITKKHIENIKPHTLPIPHILDDSDLKSKYKVIYNGMMAYDRTTSFPTRINLSRNKQKPPYLCLSNIHAFLSSEPDNLIKLLSDELLIVNICRNYCKGEGFDAPEKLICILREHYYLNNENTIIYSDNPIIWMNIAYVFPEMIEKSLSSYKKLFNKLTVHDLTLFLSRRDAAKSLYKNLKHLEFLDENLALVISLSTAAYSNSPPDELNLLKKIISKTKTYKNQKSERIIKTITERIDRLEKLIKDTSDKNVEKPTLSSELRVLLLVGGQLRDFENAMATWKEYFSGVKSIDCIVSTWSDPGYKKFKEISLNQDIRKFFDDNTVEQYLSGKLDVSKIESAYAEYYNTERRTSEIQEIIKERLNWVDNLQIYFHNEKEKPYSSMNSPEKYYFHHDFLYKKIEKDINEYDVIIKIRPDLKFHTLNNNIKYEIEKITHNVILADGSGFFFAPWGIGMGDQLLMFTPKNAKKILSPLSENLDINFILSSLGKPTHCFHTLLAVSSWYNGMLCAAFRKYTRAGLSIPKKISVDIKDNV